MHHSGLRVYCAGFCVKFKTVEIVVLCLLERKICEKTWFAYVSPTEIVHTCELFVDVMVYICTGGVSF